MLHFGVELGYLMITYTMNYQIDSEITAFLELSASAYPENVLELSMHEHRECYRVLCDMFQAPIPNEITKQDSFITGRNGHAIPIRNYYPRDNHSKTLILYLHGGGFVVGNLESHDSICAEIAHKTNINLISIDYRLAPEHLHPTQIEDMQDAFLALDTGRTIIVGDSAGSTLAAALCITQKNTDRQPIGQLLIYPYLGGMYLDLESHREGTTTPAMTSQDVEDFISLWCGGKPDWKDPTFAPILHTDLVGLPLCMALAAEIDPLRDDALVYIEKLTAAGNKARVILDKGLPHGHLRARHMMWCA